MVPLCSISHPPLAFFACSLPRNTNISRPRKGWSGGISVYPAMRSSRGSWLGKNNKALQSRGFSHLQELIFFSSQVFPKRKFTREKMPTSQSSSFFVPFSRLPTHQPPAPPLPRWLAPRCSLDVRPSTCSPQVRSASPRQPATWKLVVLEGMGCGLKIQKALVMVKDLMSPGANVFISLNSILMDSLYIIY